MAGTAANVTLGAGWLYMAPLGTTEPADSVTALPSAWIALGYTEDGSELTFEQTNDKIMVAETNYPVRVVNSASSVKVKTAMAEPTLRNMKAALGGGTGGLNTALSLEMPTDLTGIMLVHDSHEGTLTTNRRKVLRECYPTGSVSSPFKKAPNKTVINVEFEAVLPSGQTSPIILLKPTGTSVVL